MTARKERGKLPDRRAKAGGQPPMVQGLPWLVGYRTKTELRSQSGQAIISGGFSSEKTVRE